MRLRRIEPDELKRRIEAGETYESIGLDYGLAAISVFQAARDYGLTKPQLDHKWALPWVLAPEHKASKVAKYLRDLSSIAQGKKIREGNKATAIRWAERLVERGLDIDYSRDTPPNPESPKGGFYTKPASKAPGQWHVKVVLEKAKRGAVRDL